jgi:hypothetical protein
MDSFFELLVASPTAAQKSVRFRASEKEQSQPTTQSIKPSSSDLYWLNVLNLPATSVNERENSSSKATAPKGQTTSSSRLYWWM